MKKIPQILVGVDRDNTINYDREGYYGSEDNWRETLEFCPHAIEGLKLLSEDQNIALVVVSAQVGIAKGMFDSKRVDAINQKMDEVLRANGVNIQSWQYCPFVSQSGAERWKERGVTTINYDYVLPDSDERLNQMKPQDGLLRKAAKELSLDYDSVSKYFIGDRSTDVMCGINAGGIGILVNHPEVLRRDGSYDSITPVKQMVAENTYQGKVFIVNHMIEAAKIIKSQID